MGKKRNRKTGYLFVLEGDDEEKLLCVFKKLYTIHKKHISFKEVFAKGGDPDSIITSACHKKDTVDFTYVLLDNDIPMKSDNKTLWQAWTIGGTPINGKTPSQLVVLNKNDRNPILIVSEPLAMENTLLDLFSIEVTADNTKDLKTQVRNHLGTNWDKKITRKMLESSTNSVIQELVKIFREIENISLRN